ncbi:MAG: AraC family transcriptional regulator [Pseudomonas sp.]
MRNFGARNKLLKLQKSLSSILSKSGDLKTDIPGLMLSRRNLINQSEHCFYLPLVSIAVQGAKRSMIGSVEYYYGEGDYLVAGVDIPSTNNVTKASENRPFLCISLLLDKQSISQLLSESSLQFTSNDKKNSAIYIANANVDMLDAFFRLIKLLKKPQQRDIVAPLIIREIHYLLLIGPLGDKLLSLNKIGSLNFRISQTIAWLRLNYKSQFMVGELAKKCNMSSASFYRKFKEITSLTPLQYQKHLRLYEAQRLMLHECMDATTAAINVGYTSVTQFNREYKRQFGCPPHKDIMRRMTVNR